MTTKFETALRLIDAAHIQDPRLITIPSTTLTPTTPATQSQSQPQDAKDQIQIPYELHYANQMTTYLTLRLPTASEYLRLAIRAQHLKRWEVPRDTYPHTKPGYYAWRGYLAKRQAEITVQICLESGYSKDEAGRVGALVRKEGLRKEDEDGEVQVLEDVACLVFLDGQLEEFEGGVGDEGKVVDILRKTWGKMSLRGRELAIGIGQGRGRVMELVGKALS